MNYKDFNDFELLDYIYGQNEDANEILLYKYRPLIVSIAKKYQPKDGTFDLNDLVQEGMLALNSAITNYNDSKNANFGTFAKLCIERRIANYIRSFRRDKNKVLSEAISYDLEEDNSMDKFLADRSLEPLTVVTNLEDDKLLVEQINKDLTKLEQEVFHLKLKGYDYKEIAKRLNKSPKAIDNTIQRIKVKIKNILDYFD
ncbi:MAG: sigma-70 family RNA polymerase sigma factor [Candidatus Faecisoma sp.]|nr:sigma-70 family RNA polymerase sigma factor [Acholeplasma sp.]MDY2892281.1 sigma-70 family RNA polymerase sigma factor [Candidatus Faecisoma sp.]